MDLLSLREHYTTPSVSCLAYTVKSQAALYNGLSLLNGSETPEIVYNILSTVSYLASVDVMATSPAANIHIGALYHLVTRYAEMVGPQSLQRASMNIIAVFWMDAVKAYLGSKRPTLDLKIWLPFLGADTETVEPCESPGSEDGGVKFYSLHEAVEDEALKSLIMKQRQLNCRYRKSIRTEQSPLAMLLISITLHCEGLRINQLLYMVAEVEHNLLRPLLSLKRMQREYVRGCICLAVLLLSQAILPGSLSLDLIFDVASCTLHRLKNVMSTGQLHEGELLQLDRPLRDARLWALAVAVHVELHRKQTLGSHTACGERFLERLRSEATSMDIHSWQHAVSIFEQFFYSDQVKPQISDWWDRIVSGE